MDHIVYLDHKSRELENLKKGIKTMIIRGAMGRKLPYGRVDKGDVLYFIENKGDGLVKAKATVAVVMNTEQLTKEESIHLVEKNQKSLCLDNGLFKRFAGKRFLVLISIKEFSELSPFKIDKSDFSNMDDWLPVIDIEIIKV